MGTFNLICDLSAFWSCHETINDRALGHDQGRIAILILVLAAAVMCIGAKYRQLYSIASELS